MAGQKAEEASQKRIIAGRGAKVLADGITCIDL